jgi:hypothetical protein
MNQNQEVKATVEPRDDSYPHGHAEPTAYTADRVAKVVTELGAGWARYGLTLGRLALQQSARTLESTAELLGVIANKVEKASETVQKKVEEAAKKPD